MASDGWRYLRLSERFPLDLWNVNDQLEITRYLGDNTHGSGLTQIWALCYYSDLTPRKGFSRWQCGGQGKLCPLWLKSLSRRFVTVVIQGPSYRTVNRDTVHVLLTVE